MLRNGREMKFQSKMMEQNEMYRLELPDDLEYENGGQFNSEKATSMKSKLEQLLEEERKDKNQPVMNLEDIWESLEAQNNEIKSKIKVSLMDIGEQPIELTEEQLNQVFGAKQTEAANSTKPTNSHNQQQAVEDFNDMWNQLDEHNEHLQNQAQPSNVDVSQKSKQKIKDDNSKENGQSGTAQITDTFQIIESGNSNQIAKGLNLKLGEDFLLYDYSSFVINCFQTNIRCYFGFYQSQLEKNRYFLYDLSTKQSLIECCLSEYQDINANSKNKLKVDYDTKYCLKFRLSRSQEHIATVFHKPITNGILYNLKPFNCYERKYEDSFALIQITDGYAASNCFCNTSVFISQKYTNLPGQLKMIIGVKSGLLIANMGLAGVRSSPYNCRLENNQSKFVYLLGLIDKQSEHFVVRVGEGMSPLLAFAISIGRKRYIQSFKEQ